MLVQLATLGVAAVPWVLALGPPATFAFAALVAGLHLGDPEGGAAPPTSAGVRF